MPEDLRVQHTRKRIQETFINLTVEKGYEAITVQDIVDRAGVNRSTFYRHYLDKDDLLSKYMDEVIGVTFKDDDVSDKRNQIGEPLSGSVKLLCHIQTFTAFYQIMLSANGHPLVADRLRRKIENRLRLQLTQELQQRDSKSPQVDMWLHYISAAGIGAILWWVENNTPCTADELAAWIGQLSNASLDFSFKLPTFPIKTT